MHSGLLCCTANTTAYGTENIHFYKDINKDYYNVSKGETN